MERWIVSLKKAGMLFWITTGTILLFIVAALDYTTGDELSFSLFYFIPVIILSWTLKGNAGIASAFVSALLSFLIEIISGTEYSNVFAYLWNALIRLGFFLFPALLLRDLEKEKKHARTDFLTDAYNNRFFNELMQNEINRYARYQHPFTIAFIDLDNFKIINDTFGHTFGDAVLRNIADGIKQNLRKTDIVARMGGDEFAILLPETGTEAAKITISHMQIKLMDKMLKNKWPVTFSIGVLTLTRSNLTVDEILGSADRLMYSVKNNGKNDIKYSAR